VEGEGEGPGEEPPPPPPQLAFVNGLPCGRGAHVDLVWRHLLALLREGLERMRGGKDAAAAFRPPMAREVLCVFVRAAVPDPAFTSQGKEELATPARELGVAWAPSPGFASALGRMGVYDALRARCDAAALAALVASGAGGTRAARGRAPHIAKYDGARNAGRAGAACTLLLTEGDSAKALAVAGLAAIGRADYGIMALKGKLLNARAASAAQLAANAEIRALARILGLRYGVPVASLADLRYARVMIFADQDLDGAHIAGLVLNWMHACFPSVLGVDPGYIVRMVTPLTRVRPPRAPPEAPPLAFFTEQAMVAWAGAAGVDLRACGVKYYKGLGTSTSREGRAYFADLAAHTTRLVFTGPPCAALLEAMFAAGGAPRRRALLEERYDPDAHVAYGTGADVSYGEFIERELLHFSMADNVRSIPALADGLKPSQRKVLYTLLQQGGSVAGRDAKVPQLVATVATATAYHHGEASLTETVVGMAQDHVGTNDLALLVPQGQFGSRLQPPRVHAAPRYLHTRLDPVASALFPAQDDAILQRRVEDGAPVEPHHLLPVLCLAIVNGASGIGTGWSTDIPPFGARPVLGATRAALAAGCPAHYRALPPLAPEYRGWTGRVEGGGDGSGSFVLRGRFERLPGGVRVLELPPGVWTENWLATMEGLRSKGVLASIENASTDAAVDVVLRWPPGGGGPPPEPERVERLLGLCGRASTRNMHLFGEDGRVVRFADPAGVLEAFHGARLLAYGARRDALAAAAVARASDLDTQARFVEGVVGGALPLLGATGEEVRAGLAAAAPPFAPDAQGSFRHLLNMRCGAFTAENAATLRASAAAAHRDGVAMAASTPEALWGADLDRFELALDAYERAHALRYAVEPLAEPGARVLPPKRTAKRARRPGARKA
jgi:DNA topoisomerase-2